ncbi:MAG: transporter permease [Cryobacterium sp.]|nr:transporter permease [Cryobacterium sp.]
MVAQFLGLKLRLLANLFRRSPWQVVGVVVGLLYGIALATVLVVILVRLRYVDDIELVRDGMILAGSAVVLGFLLLPLVFRIDDSMDPRAFALLGIRNSQLSLGLAVAALIGVPALTLASVLLGSVYTWSRGFGETTIALLCALLLLATCTLASRVSTSIAAFLLSTRRSRELSGILGILVLVMIAPVVVLVLNIDWPRSGVDLMTDAAGVLGWTPLGAAWAAPGDAAAGDWGAALLKVLIGAASAYLLWLAWQALVAKMLVTPGREAQAKQYGGLGWFDRMPHNAIGAIAARSLTYWGRDSRYWASLIMIPVVPVLVLLPLTVAGVPASFLALLPVPLMCVFLGWTMHNDVAYDSTAIWLHIASGTRGTADRIGRLVPALLVGIPLIGLGSVVSAFFFGDWNVLPSMLGVSTSIFLAGLGFSSYTSARFPYPAPKPGDSPFAQPQAADTAAALIQSVSFIGSIILSLPAIILALLGLFLDPVWHLPALYAGIGIGVLAVSGGIWLGSRSFERHGPEIIASALRA